MIAAVILVFYFDYWRLWKAKIGRSTADARSLRRDDTSEAGGYHDRIGRPDVSQFSSGGASQVGGIIQKRLFTEGADVKAGQALFQIDPALYQAALDNAKAALSRSEANLPAIRLKSDRLRELLAEKAVSQQDCDDAAAALKQVQADIQYGQATVETARINLKYTSITAPISGRIGKSNVTEGSLVTAQQPTVLATIQRLDPMYVDVPQSTAEVLRLRRGLKEGRLDQSGANQKRFNSSSKTVQRIHWREPFNSATSRRSIRRPDRSFYALFPQSETIYFCPACSSGQWCRKVSINQAILIPQQAVSRDPRGNPFTLIIDEKSNVQQRMLTLDRAIGDQWLVSSGLAPGERVIIEGMQKVKPGAPVKAVPFETGGKNSGERKDALPPSSKSN